MRRRLFGLGLALATVCLIATSFGLPLADAQSGGPDYDIANGHFYTQARGNAPANYGYRITDDGGIGFWSEFQRLGGVTALGYPASTRFQLNGFTVQATQKYILQWRPEVSQVYFENVFDDLHNAGQDSALQQQFGIPPQADPNISQATRMSWLNGDAAIAGSFGTGPAALQANGLPTSQVTVAGPFSIMRFERDAIQHWNQAGPGGITPGTVSVVNGGDVAKALGLVPASAQVPETSTGQPLAAPTPAATPTPAFEYQSKAVTDPPVDCSVGNNSNGQPTSSIPCLSVAPNSGTQYIKGRVMDQKGNHLQFVTVQATLLGVNCTQSNGQQGPCVLTSQTAGDGTFTFFIAGGPPGSTINGGSSTAPCPPYALTYNIMVISKTGAQDSDVYTVKYDGNCNSDGEFHFDFVKVR